MVYLVDDDASGCAGACADTNLLACTSNTDCPAAVFEYNGQYGSPVDLKAAGGGAWCVDATIEGGFQSLSGLSTAAAVCSTTIGTDFSTDFPGASGVAVAKITITLPLGADGSKFHVHQHYTAATKAFLNAGAGNEGLWVKRRRNNNGRTFTLNKVYENRVASVSHMADDNTAGTMTVTYVNTDDSAQGSEPLFSFAAVTNHLWDDDTAPFIQGMKTTRFNDHCGKTGASSTPFVILEDGTTDVTLVCKDTDFATAADLVEHGEKYAYVGLGPDRLYVDPQPDPMTNQAAVITYTGPSGSCSVTEVTRGSTEAKECSGRGNCDYETGTCSCDEGYTLEACSEQTVLV